jgi:cardiolipin synthase
MIWHAGVRYSVVGLLATVLSFLVVLYIVNRNDRESFKLSWVAFVLAVPLFGGALYFMFRIQSAARGVRKKMRDSERRAREVLAQNSSVRDELAKLSPSWVNQIDYLINVPGFPVYKHTETEYVSDGMQYFNRMLDEIAKAERYIFLEVFIIRRGWMWDTLLEALIAKANAQYAAAQASLRRGDLATYARQIQALGKTLAQLKAARP